MSSYLTQSRECLPSIMLSDHIGYPQSFNLHSNTLKQALDLSPFYRLGNTGLEKVNPFALVAQLAGMTELEFKHMQLGSNAWTCKHNAMKSFQKQQPL